MPYIQRNDKLKLHYMLDDFTDPWRNSSCLILQHGLGRSSRLWYNWVPYLSRFYKVVRPDLRGHGQSSSDFDLEKDLTVDAFIEDVIAIINSLGVDSVHYCGESLGGLLGIALAGKYPERVKTLTLVSAPVYFHERALKYLACGRPTFADALKELGLTGWFDAMKAARFPLDTNPGLLKLSAEEFGESKVEVLIALSHLIEKVNVTSYLSQIKAPVLGLYPAIVAPGGEGQQELLYQYIPNIRIIHIPSRYHTFRQTSPASCATHVLHFVSQYDGVPCHEL